MIHNEVKSTFGTGINAVVPGHDLESLKIAAHYNLDKSGVLNKEGMTKDEVGIIYSGKDVLKKNDETN